MVPCWRHFPLGKVAGGSRPPKPEALDPVGVAEEEHPQLSGLRGRIDPGDPEGLGEFWPKRGVP